MPATMLRTLDHRLLLNSRHTYSLLLRCSYTLVQRCCMFRHHHNNLIKPRTARSSPSPSPSPCPCPCSVPAAKMLNPPPSVVVAISNALRSAVLKPLLPQMPDSAIAGHMSNLMKQQQPPVLPSHLLRVGCPFSARAALLLPLLHKPTLHLPRFPTAAPAGSSLYNYYYITNFNFNAAAAATARRQFSTSPSSTDPAADERPAVNVNQGGGGDDAHAMVVSSSSGSMPSLIGSEGGFQSCGNTQKLDVMDDMESQGSTPPSFPAADERPAVNVNQGGGGDARALVVVGGGSGGSSSEIFWEVFWDFLIFALRAHSFYYVYSSSKAQNEKNRKSIVCDPKMLEEVDKRFRESIQGSETLPSSDHFSCKVRSILEGILSNMDKVINQRPPSLNGIKWEIVASKVPGLVGESYPIGKIIINPSSSRFNVFLQMESWSLLSDMRHELEADYIGTLLSASAGYDPVEAIKYFIDEDWVPSSSIPSFLRVHPPDEKRA